MSRISIQTYSGPYQDQIIQLTLKIAEEFGFPLSAADQPDLMEISKHYQKGRGNFWIALDNQKVVGTFALMDIGNKQGALKKVFVDKNYRGAEKGLAKSLWETVKHWCEEQHIQELYLGTRTIFYAAQRFYEKNGFKEIAKEDLPKKFPINEVDAVFYKYQF